MSIYKEIIFDFDGVLCKDYFYTNLKTIYPDVHKFIQENIFCQQSKILDKWMRGQLTSGQINKFISKNTNIDLDTLNRLFIKNVESMRLENKLIDLVKRMKESSFQVALVTNNMDVFDTVTVEKHHLDKLFSVIVNSFNYGVLKHEENGKLFDVAMNKLGSDDYSSALLIDDSAKARRVFEQKGGSAFAYDNYDDFLKWANKNLK